MTEIRKITGIVPTNKAAVEAAFAGIEPQAIACCNWPDQFPYAPEVSFRMFHTGDYLMLRFDVAERYTAALVTEDNGEVWTDSCAEFFIAPDTGMYYNFETTCIGRMLLGARKSRTEAEHASPEVLAGVKRYTTLPCGEPFAEREGDNRWSLTLAIPPQALFRHGVDLILRHRHAHGVKLVPDVGADLLPAHLHEGGQMGQGDGLPAVLVAGHLCHDLCGYVAGSKEAVGLFNHGFADYCTVLKHILQIDQITVVLLLSIIVCIMEMDNSCLMSLYNLLWQKYPAA